MRGIARFLVLLTLLLPGFFAGPTGAQEATPVASALPDLTGVTPLPLTGQLRTEFEAYVAAALGRFGVPGASVAVVQGGDVGYLQGFGVREIGSTAPVTPDTLMMIGSVTKSMTSLMAATVVDEGLVSWETPVVTLLPEFAVADPALTPRLTLADTFRACTGMPRRDVELFFNSDELTPDALIASIPTLPLTAPFGERFQYSNQMYAVGGYVATIAAGAAPGDLFRGYRLAMRERVLQPLGMGRSTFALEAVVTSGDYAAPHGTDLSGATQPIPLLLEDRFVNGVAPAGALWSSAREMARYLQMQLDEGIAPDGTPVVSAANLARLHTSRVALPPDPTAPPALADMAQGYGLGWLIGGYGGQRLLSHSGGTLGFVSEVAFLPEADLGLVVLTNGGSGAGPFAYAVQYRLLELLFAQPAAIDAAVDPYLAGAAAQMAELANRLGPVDPVAVADYLGRFSNPALGEITLRLEDGRLILDAGEVKGELRPLLDETGATSGYLIVDPPLAGTPRLVTLHQTASGGHEIEVTLEDEESLSYRFVAIA